MPIDRGKAELQFTDSMRLDKDLMETFFAPCPRGLEFLLSQEIERCGGKDVRQYSGGVACRGTFSLCYILNLKSRLASRVLWRLGEGKYHHEQDLYRSTFALPWSDLFSVECLIKVRIIAKDSPLKSLEFGTLRVKDAICDRFMQDRGTRPTVDKRQPDVPIVVFLTGDRVEWYVDTSGAPLFKRGWRKASGEAPIRENLAAGILGLTGWTPDQVLLDPMCGAGTFLIEAAMIGRGIPPGKGRKFSFSRLKNFDRNTWEQVRQTGDKAEQKPQSLALFGYDQKPQALDMARLNSRGLEISEIRWTQEDALAIVPPAGQGIIVTNPPYGVRMGNHTELEEWYPRFGDVLKKRFAGWRVHIFTADLRMPKLLRLSPSKKIPLFNGSLESRLYEFRMVAGENRKAARLAKRTQTVTNR